MFAATNYQIKTEAGCCFELGGGLGRLLRSRRVSAVPKLCTTCANLKKIQSSAQVVHCHLQCTVLHPTIKCTALLQHLQTVLHKSIKSTAVGCALKCTSVCPPSQVHCPRYLLRIALDWALLNLNVMRLTAMNSTTQLHRDQIILIASAICKIFHSSNLISTQLNTRFFAQCLKLHRIEL